MGKYKLIPNSHAENLLAVTGTAGGPAVAVGALGLVLDVTPQVQLPRMTIPAFSKLLTGVASAPGLTYLVGEQGTVYRSDAAGINPVIGLPRRRCGPSSITGTDAWVVGCDGTICKVTGSDHHVLTRTAITRWFNGVYAASATSHLGRRRLGNVPSRAAPAIVAVGAPPTRGRGKRLTVRAVASRSPCCVPATAWLVVSACTDAQLYAPNYQPNIADLTGVEGDLCTDDPASPVLPAEDRRGRRRRHRGHARRPPGGAAGARQAVRRLERLFDFI